MVAVAEGGPCSLIEHGETGLLVAPAPEARADAVLSLVASPLLHERLRRAALAAVHGRTWESSLQQLAAGYRIVLDEHAAHGARDVA